MKDNIQTDGFVRKSECTRGILSRGSGPTIGHADDFISEFHMGRVHLRVGLGRVTLDYTKCYDKCNCKVYTI